MDDTRLFLKITEEKYQRFLNNYAPDAGDFLTLEQQSILAPFLSAHAGEGVFLFGGYSEAERKRILFMPDYTGVSNEDEALEYFTGNPEESPFSVLDISVSPKEHVALGHRDYLGALMGEGIRREKVGDIIIRENGAQLIVAREMAEYLLKNYSHVGRAAVTGRLLPLSELDTSIIRTELQKFTVASPRLDNVVSSVFNVSRKSAVEAIKSGLVYVSGVQSSKPDHTLRGGEKIVLRGRGKAVYQGETGTSKKGKSYILVTRYI